MDIVARDSADKANRKVRELEEIVNLLIEFAPEKAKARINAELKRRAGFDDEEEDEGER